MIVWLIFGILELIGGIICIVLSGGNFYSIIVGVYCILVATAHFSIVGLCYSSDEHEKAVKSLQKQLDNANAKIHVLSGKLGIDNLDELVEKDIKERLGSVTIDEMNLGFPLTLLVEKTSFKHIFPVGTKGTFYQKNQDDYIVRVIEDDKDFFVHCTKEEIENAYLFELKQEHNDDQP